MVFIPPKYKTMVADSSDKVVTHINTAAAPTEGPITGSTTRTKLPRVPTPRLIDASSMESLRLCKGPVAERTRLSTRRKKYASAMMTQVPVNASGPLLNELISAIPRTALAMEKTTPVAVAMVDRNSELYKGWGALTNA